MTVLFSQAKAARVGIAMAALTFFFSAGAELHAQTLRKITVAGQTNMGGACLFLAEAQGYFKDEGLELNFQDLGSPQNAVMAAVSGSADFGFGGLTAGFFNLATKGGLKLIASSSMEQKGFNNVGIVATNAAYAAGLRSFKDLAGKRVGLTTVGGPAHYDLAVIAEKSGYDISKVTVVPLQTIPNLVAAFKGGQIDAMLQSAPMPRRLENEGVGKVIGWASELVQAQAAVVYARPALIANERAVVQRFVRAYVRGCGDYNGAFNQLDASGKIVKGPGYDKLLQMLSVAVKLPPDQIADGMNYIDAKGRLAVDDLRNSVSFWKKLGMVGADTDVDKLLDVSFTEGHL